VGCDYAGTVLAIGTDVTKKFKIGDRVYGCAHGSHYTESYSGVFAEYAMVKGDVAMHVPTNPDVDLTMNDLSTLPLGCITVGQGLFQPRKGLSLAWPEEGKANGEWVLIYGGSTATGTLGIQFAKLAGYRVVTTCSPRNYGLVISRGADEVFDYNDPACAAKIRALTENNLKYAWDTVGESPNICAEALSSDSTICHYGTILYNKFPREELKYTATEMYTMFGEYYYKYGQDFPVITEDFEFAKRWMNLTEQLVAERKIKPHPKRVESGGLDGILKGLQDLGEERVSGEKLVYSI
jgi:NADPH:quinone reductase-like Zn-dependent oxidoreductase